jgi:hypothetical protein
MEWDSYTINIGGTLQKTEGRTLQRSRVKHITRKKPRTSLCAATP